MDPYNSKLTPPELSPAPVCKKDVFHPFTPQITIEEFVKVIVKDDRNLLLLIINQGANVNAIVSPPLLTATKFKQVSVLYFAIRGKYNNSAEILIRKGADVNYRVENMSVLDAAISVNSPYLCKLLIEYGADVNWVLDTITSLEFACRLQYHDIIEILLQNGARLEKYYNETNGAIPLVINQDDDITFRLFILYGLNVNTKDVYGTTILMNACEKNAIKIVKLLLEYNTKINLMNSFTKTALHYAVEYNSTECMELLLKFKAPVNFDHYPTPLDIAYSKDNLIAIRSLLEYGANVKTMRSFNVVKNMVNNEAILKLLSVCYAQSKEKCIITQFDDLLGVQLFKRATHVVDSTNINQRSVEGNTFLHIAAKNNMFDFVKILIEKGANPSIYNQNGLKPTDMSTDEKISNYLLNHELKHCSVFCIKNI